MRTVTRDLRCRHCGRAFDPTKVFATFDGDRATYFVCTAGGGRPAHRRRDRKSADRNASENTRDERVLFLGRVAPSCFDH